MPSINIFESDNTITTPASVDTVVFIPGFINSETTIFDKNFPVKGEIRVFKTLTEFDSLFGNTAPMFISDQYHPSNFVGLGTKVMFSAGSFDLGFKLARELLQKGLPIAFTFANEVVNNLSFMGYVSELPEEAVPTAIYQLIKQDTAGRSPGAYIYTEDGWDRQGPTYLANPSVASMYSLLTNIFDNFEDKTEGLSISYITSGGYPIAEYSSSAGIPDLVTKVLQAASVINAIALIDHTNNPERPLIGSGSIFDIMQNSQYINGQFGAMFTPWSLDNALGVEVPASFHYLYRLADAKSTSDSWLAIAGVTRGRVNASALQTGNNILTNKVANMMTADSNIVSINPITNVKPYGLTIWGNRTLANFGSLKATSFLNIRGIVNDIKKVAYRAATSLMFEQNNEILWVNFKSKVAPVLDKLSTAYGIQRYVLQKEVSVDKKQLKARIILYPLYAVEGFDITIELKDDNTQGGNV